jgi:hypothetical protein
MAPTDDAVKDIRKRIKQHQRGIFCRAVMWDGIASAVTVGTARGVLDSLPPEDQLYLRDAYAEWPPSLWAQAEAVHPVCAAIEAWCRRPEGE